MVKKGVAGRLYVSMFAKRGGKMKRKMLSW